MMPEVPETRESLLIAIRDPADELAWQRFSQIYRPMVYRIARKMGLQPSDAEDVAQHVMLTVADTIRGWSKDSTKGNFRAWLTVVAKNAIRNAISRVPKDRGSGGSDVLQSVGLASPSSDEWERQIETEFLRSIFRAAAVRVRPEFAPTTWDAFWLTCADGVSVDEAGQRLGLSSGAIYAARSRVMRRLQKAVGELVSEEDQ